MTTDTEALRARSRRNLTFMPLPRCGASICVVSPPPHRRIARRAMRRSAVSETLRLSLHNAQNNVELKDQP